MSANIGYYASDVGIVAAVDVLASWGLNLQYGMAGINSFAFIVFQAAGAYTAAVLTIGPSSEHGSFEQYVGGAHLPFPLPVLIGGVVAGLLALLIGLLVLRRLRGDYEAIVLLVLSLIATGIANAAIGLVNGPPGLALIPKPLASTLALSPVGYQWAYLVWAALVVLVVLWGIRRLQIAPFGRALRAVRENEAGAAAMGINPDVLRIQAFAIGGVIGGLSGAILVEYVGAWGPSSWTYPETFILLAAIIIGGRGNMGGVTLGTLLLPVGLLEATRFLPEIVFPGFIDNLEWVIVGLSILAFLWIRPQGLLPERRRRFSEGGPPDPVPRMGRSVDADATASTLEETVARKMAQ